MPPEQGFGPSHPLHHRDAKPGRGDADPEKHKIIWCRDRDPVFYDEYRVRPDEPADDERPGQGRNADRGQGLQCIDADDQLEGIEGTGERSIESRCNRAGGATADQGADVVPPQTDRSAEPGRERGPNLRVGRLEPHRGSEPAGK